ncbi:Uncharacterized protein HZ326_4693 [Fusarium oxysporum f. sp. albedinis]|nr:Uncharacterized protein HZ326_4693 [Fusarium oxysporum f. sp. albedinis]
MTWLSSLHRIRDPTSLCLTMLWNCGLQSCRDMSAVWKIRWSLLKYLSHSRCFGYDTDQLATHSPPYMLNNFHFGRLWIATGQLLTAASGLRCIELFTAVPYTTTQFLVFGFISHISAWVNSFPRAGMHQSVVYDYPSAWADDSGYLLGDIPNHCNSDFSAQ